MENILHSEKQLARITEKAALIKRFQASGQSLRAFAASEGIPASTLCVDLKRGRGGLGEFLDKRARNGRRAEIDDRALTWTLAFLAARRRSTLSAAWRELQPVAVAEGWKYPTYSQLARAVGRLPADARDLLVHGARHLFEKWGLVQRKESAAPNELWHIDATQLGVWTLEMESGKQIQPWAIGIIDACSRVVLGVYVMKSAPTTADLLQAFRTAMLAKNDERFPFFGIPKSVQTDNGSIFKSGDFLDVLLRLGIERVATENDCPSDNGKIERFFKTVESQLLSRLSSYAHQHRGLAAAKANPIPWPMMQKLVDRFLYDYHLRNHGSLGKSPWETWHDRLDAAYGLSMSVADVIDACKIRVEKTVARDGIEMGPGRHLSAPELAGLVGETVTLRLLPEGGDTEADCYYRGEKVATLRVVERDGELADKIKTARLDRARELARLRKSLLKTANRMLGPSQSHLPPGEPRLLPPPAAAAEDDEPLDVPNLDTEDDESE
jgi:putative transposase